MVFLGMGIGAMLTPVAARVEQAAPVLRGVLVGVGTTSKEIPKVHWGIYALAEYDYSPSGKMTVVKKSDLIIEEDMSMNHGGHLSSVKLKTGEYEIHVQPDNSRTIVKHFIVNNLSSEIVNLSFNVAPIEDDTERNKTEVVRIGPSLSDMESRIQVLEKKAGITDTSK